MINFIVTLSHVCDRLWEYSSITLSSLPYSTTSSLYLSNVSPSPSTPTYERKYECFLMNLTPCIHYDLLSLLLFLQMTQLYCSSGWWYSFARARVCVCVCVSYTHLLMVPVLVHNLSFASSITTVCEVPVLDSDFDSFWFISRRGLVGWY